MQSFWRLIIFSCRWQVVAVAEDDSSKKSLPKRRKLDECTHLTDKAETIKEFFSDLDWVLEKLNNGSVLQVSRVADYLTTIK